MTKRARVYDPKVQIMLHKTIKRQQIAGGVPVSARYSGTEFPIDLTPYLVESGGIRTTKSVRDPAGGFSLLLGDKPYKGGLGFETLYALIEPMDIIEIRMRHGAGAGKPPIVMRGFVSNVGRSESMGPDGKPSRVVNVSGQDYGKLWQMFQIKYLPNYVIGQDTISSYKMYQHFGVGFKIGQSGADFLKSFINDVLNKNLANVIPSNPDLPAAVKTDKISAAHGTTSIGGMQNTEDTFYGLLHRYLDVGPWNELFMQDEEDGVYCIYRPNPFKDVQGVTIQSDAVDPGSTDLVADDIISLNVERTDSDVANYYWVNGPRFSMSTDVYRKLYAYTQGDRSTVDLSDYDNSKVSLYGIRFMDATSEMGGDDVQNFSSGLPEPDQLKRDTSLSNWLNDRREILVNQNKDNVVLEHGSIRCRGNEAIRAGTFVNVIRGDFSAEYYVVSVIHDYVPFQGFFTTLIVERGMGFVERSKRGAPTSPYLTELG